MALLATALSTTAVQASPVRTSDSGFAALRTLPTGTRVTQGKGRHVSDVAPSTAAIAILAGAAVAGGVYAGVHSGHHNASSPGGN
jgi:hypothetical protein